MPVASEESIKAAEEMIAAATSNIGIRVALLERRVRILEKHVSDILNEDIREPLQGEIVLEDSDASKIAGAESDDVSGSKQARLNEG